MAKKDVVQFIVETVQNQKKINQFVKAPKRALKKYPLTKKERKILRKGLFRKKVCGYLKGRGGLPILEGGG